MFFGRIRGDDTARDGARDGAGAPRNAIRSVLVVEDEPLVALP